jgi:hypothetical protein
VVTTIILCVVEVMASGLRRFNSHKATHAYTYKYTYILTYLYRPLITPHHVTCTCAPSTNHIGSMQDTINVNTNWDNFLVGNFLSYYPTRTMPVMLLS